MKHWLAAFGLCAALVLAPPAVAEEPPESEDPGELARDGVERLMRALEAFIDMIPQYEMPEINENGDIIIRRKRHVEPSPEEDDEEGLDQTQT
jgi:hypothetical protein